MTHLAAGLAPRCLLLHASTTLAKWIFGRTEWDIPHYPHLIKKIHGTFAVRKQVTPKPCRQFLHLFRAGAQRLLAIQYGFRADRITFQCAERFAGDGADDNGRDGRIENRTSWPPQPHAGNRAPLLGQRTAR